MRNLSLLPYGGDMTLLQRSGVGFGTANTPAISKQITTKVNIARIAELRLVLS